MEHVPGKKSKIKQVRKLVICCQLLQQHQAAISVCSCLCGSITIFSLECIIIAYYCGPWCQTVCALHTRHAP